ncbi:hypothetical protein KC845_03040 [Candidatus Kaiserbacteria bacterium]|nr:hypothetical protein [Candidatus Kaiserbacteria bacterium]
MKKLIVFSLIFLLVVAAYFVFTHSLVQKAEAPMISEEVLPEDKLVEGVITEINLDQMAYDGPALYSVRTPQNELYTIAMPSMGRNLCQAKDHLPNGDEMEIGDFVEVFGQLNEGNQIIPCESNEHYLTLVGGYSDAELGFFFIYPKAPAGYVLVDSTASSTTKALAQLSLFNRTEYQELQNSTEARDGITSISIFVYQNEQALSLEEWAKANSLESNIEFAIDEPIEAMVGGSKALKYVIDGLYQAEVYVVAQDDNIFVLSGSYVDEQSLILADYRKFLNTFTFITTEEEVESEAETMTE